MTSELQHLRLQLTRLMRARQLIRWGIITCTMLSIGMLLLVSLFVVDRSLALSKPWTLLLLPAWLIGLALLSRRFVWPELKAGDSLEETALHIERQYGIQNDLIAALEFSNASGQQHVLSLLERSVIQRASAISRTLDYSQGLTLRTLPGRAIVLLFACSMVMTVAIAAPEPWSIFWNRVAFGSAAYPTKTQFDSIIVNGQQIRNSSTIPAVSIPYGRAVALEVICRGILPANGKATLTSVDGATRNEFLLNPLRAAPNTFRGELQSIHETCRVVIQAGDEATKPIELVVVPLPQVDVTWQIRPPDYIQRSISEDDYVANSFQFSAYEGSEVQLQLHCQNKNLKSAQLRSAGTQWELRPVDQSRQTWTLPIGTPFDELRSNLTCDIQVLDRDDLSLAKPISCEIRLQPDLTPKISASAVTQLVLPAARPKLDFVATDDFGIAQITAHVRAFREDGRRVEFDVPVVEFAASDQPVTTLRDQIPLSLAPYQLTKGDEVRVELVAFDWRGEKEGKTRTSDAITFKVTDLAGVLRQSNEEDKKTIKQLDEILKREQPAPPPRQSAKE